MALSGKSNVNPKIWGPKFWDVFHFTAFGYPKNPNETDKESYKQFYTNFFKILPCDVCANSSQEIFSATDLDNALVSREELIKWTYDFHDKVNVKLGKKSPSFENFVSNFTSLGNWYNISVPIVPVVLVILIILIIIFLIMRYTLNIL